MLSVGVCRWRLRDVLVKVKGYVLVKAGVWLFLQCGLRRWWHFSPHLISSLSSHAVGHREEHSVPLSVVKVCFSSHHLWLCSWLSWKTHCHKVVQKQSIQEKPGLFPGSFLNRTKLNSTQTKQKNPPKQTTKPKLMNAFVLQGRGSAPPELDQELELSTKWSCSDILWGSRTWVCSTRSQAHLREDTGVCVKGWGKLLRNIHSRYGSAQVTLEGKINKYCLDHRLFPLFFSFLFFSPLLSENSLFFFLLENPFDL